MLLTNKRAQALSDLDEAETDAEVGSLAVCVQVESIRELEVVVE